MSINTIVLLSVLCIWGVRGIMFTLAPQEVKCLHESFFEEMVVNGWFTAAPQVTGAIRLEVVDRRYAKNFDDQSLFARTILDPSNQNASFSFVTKENVDVLFCFRSNENRQNTRMQRMVRFEFDATHILDHLPMPKKEFLNMVEDDPDFAHLTVKLWHSLESINDLKVDFHKLNTGSRGRSYQVSQLDSRMFWGALITMGIIVAIGATQVFWWRTYLKKIKVL